MARFGVRFGPFYASSSTRGSGCAPILLGLLILGAAIAYWRVAIGIAVLLSFGFGFDYLKRRRRT